MQGTDFGPGCFQAPAYSGFSIGLVFLSEGCGANTDLLAHEIGHDYDLLHSSALLCNSWPSGVPMALTDPAFSDVRCDGVFETNHATFMGYSQYDFMGGYRGHTNASNKATLGWLKPSNLAEVTASDAFELDPYEPATDGLKALQVPIGEDWHGEPAAWWVEYRTKPIVDLRTRTVFGHVPTDVVLVWLSLKEIYNRHNGSVLGSYSLLLEGQGVYTALAEGQSFVDIYRGIRITRGDSTSVDGVRRASVTVQRSMLDVSPAIGARLIDGSPVEVTVTNRGTTTVTVASSSLGGHAPTRFRIQADGCSGTTLPSGSTCKVTVLQQRGNGAGTTRHDAYLKFETSDPLRPEPIVGLIGLSSSSWWSKADTRTRMDAAEGAGSKLKARMESATDSVHTQRLLLHSD